MKNILKALLILLLAQTVTLAFGIFRTDSQNEELIGAILKVAFLADLVIFSLIAIYGVLYLISMEDETLSSMALIVGSIIFIAATLAWRGTFGFIPENPLSDFLFERLIGDEPSDTILDFTFIVEIWEGLILSNFGLLIMSVGLFMHVQEGRWSFLLYGISNFIFMISPFFVVIKILPSVLFLTIGNLKFLGEGK